MFRLIAHIEKLLIKHDCVVVPGLGGFVQNITQAQTGNEYFTPSGKEISFNKNLTFNDGLIAESYQKKYNLSFEDSVKLVKTDVSVIKKTLKTRGSLNFGCIGTLSLKENSRIEFSPQNFNLLYPKSYGLTPVKYPKIVNNKSFYKEKEKFEKNNTDYFNIRLKKKAVYTVATSAAILIFMLFLTYPLLDLKNTNIQEASIAKEYLTGDILNKTNKYNITDTVPSKKTDAAISDTLKDTRKDSVAIHIAKNNTEKPVKKTTSKSYYVIIGSFQSMAQARKHLTKCESSKIFNNPGIFERNGKYRVYGKIINEKNSAGKYLNNLRSNHSEYSSSWLLAVKK